MVKCSLKKGSLSYPKHRYSPEDILNFMEATEFSTGWEEAGLDIEDDLFSLQLCIMVNPNGEMEVEDTGGLRAHSHWVNDSSSVMVYYCHFPEFGMVYLLHVDPLGSLPDFSASDRQMIRLSLENVRRGLERLKEDRSKNN